MLFVSTEETEADCKASKRSRKASKDLSMCTRPRNSTGGGAGEHGKLSLHVLHAACEWSNMLGEKDFERHTRADWRAGASAGETTN